MSEVADEPGFVARAASRQLEDLTATFRIVIVNGPRQAGKTTLLELHRQAHGGEYRTLDSTTIRESADVDPEGFVQGTEIPLIIDEVQLGGDRLVRAIKQVVDRRRTPGQFILSGSTRFLTTPGISESLAGRAVLTELWPLSVAERVGDSTDGLVNRAFTEPRSLLTRPSSWSRDDYLELACIGGYPEAVPIRNPRRRSQWFASYLETVIDRDITTLAQVRNSELLTRLLSLVAARSAGLISYNDLGRELGVSHHTAQSYLALLRTAFLTTTLNPWSTNATSRVAKTAKAFLTDSGLLAHLLRLTPLSLRRPGEPGLGPVIETFTHSELQKSQPMGDGFDLYHYRDRDGREVDFICVGPDGRIVAIEVKASLSPRPDSARHLRWLRSKIGDRFATGIVLYLGDRSLSFGDDIYLLPLSALWGHQPLQSSP